jgi:hypothetical protein
MKQFAIAAAAVLCLSACATAPKDFYEDPTKPKDTALCRAFLETKDPTFQRDAAAELVRRGLTHEECQSRVNMETAAIVAVAAVATGVAVAAACSSGCAGGGYSPSDQDCKGGSGDGPYFVQGPIWVGSYDPHNLDADNDGVGCEASDMAYGA